MLNPVVAHSARKIIDMPWFIVKDKNGLALVEAENELDAKLNLMDTCWCDIETLSAEEVPNLNELPNGVLELIPFKK